MGVLRKNWLQLHISPGAIVFWWNFPAPTPLWITVWGPQSLDRATVPSAGADCKQMMQVHHLYIWHFQVINRENLLGEILAHWNQWELCYCLQWDQDFTHCPALWEQLWLHMLEYALMPNTRSPSLCTGKTYGGNLLLGQAMLPDDWTLVHPLAFKEHNWSIVRAERLRVTR